MATALGTAGGRLVFGLKSALTSRYVTPAIMAWSALCILYFPWMANGYKKYSNKVWLPFIIILLLMLPDEWTALKDKNELNFQKKVAMLALELRVHDEERINTIFPMNRAFVRFEEADKKNFLISGMEKIKGLRNQMGQIRGGVIPKESCIGQIKTREALAADPHFVRISGWIIVTKNGAVPQSIQFLDSTRQIIGYALTGRSRVDLPNKVNRKAGFEGYIQSHPLQHIIAVGQKPSCQCIFSY